MKKNCQIHFRESVAQRSRVWTPISFMLPLDFPCCYAMRIALLSGYVSVVNRTHGGFTV